MFIREFNWGFERGEEWDGDEEEMLRAERMEVRIASPVENDALPNRNGWFSFASTKFAPDWK